MAGNSVINMIVWLVVAFIAALVMTLVGILLYRWLKHAMHAEEDASPPFSLADLRRMRDRGLMTPQEYEQAKTLMIARMNSEATSADGNQPDDGTEPPPGDPSDQDTLEEQSDDPDDGPQTDDGDKPDSR